MELKKSIVAYMELIDIMMLKMYDYKRKSLFCYNYINNPKKRMGKWCFHFFFITLPTKKKRVV